MASKKTNKLKAAAQRAAAKRSTAAKKGWETRRAEAQRRSEAARKGWATRRKEARKEARNAPPRPAPPVARPVSHPPPSRRQVIPPERYRQIESDWDDFDRDDWYDDPDESSLLWRKRKNPRSVKHATSNS